MHEYLSVTLGNEVHVSSHGVYTIEVTIFRSDERREQRTYFVSNPLTEDPKRPFKWMPTREAYDLLRQALKDKQAGDGFKFWEYRKVGKDLVKVYGDLKHFDADVWKGFVERT